MVIRPRRGQTEELGVAIDHHVPPLGLGDDLPTDHLVLSGELTRATRRSERDRNGGIHGLVVDGRRTPDAESSRSGDVGVEQLVE